MTATLNRFISRSVDKCKPFFQLLHKWKGFEWNEECAFAFQQLKDYLSRPPIMSRPEKEEMFCAYIVVTSHAVSLVLVRVENGVRRLVYSMSKSLQEAKVCYLPLEKAILAVVHTTRKLPHYFQAHTVVVLTQLSSQSLLRKTDYTGRIAKWGTIFGAFDIKYMPRTSIKGQVLADLMAEFTESLIQGEVEELRFEGKQVSVVALHGPSPWKLYVDGAANKKGSEVGLVILSPDQITIEKSLRLGFSATNNEAKYEALLVGIAMVKKMEGKNVEAFSNSRLVVGQVKGELKARDLRMQGYLSQAGVCSKVILVEDLDRHIEEKKGKVQVMDSPTSAPHVSTQADGSTAIQEVAAAT
ncbi:uncharacterized protein LOC142628520 [Castanea sativa]|uniref:uncharacterized protein LOC142628520 n=1 Tax=Castanea sativa TaxID=21020 RepID=UPI003F64D972